LSGELVALGELVEPKPVKEFPFDRLRERWLSGVPVEPELIEAFMGMIVHHVS